MTMQRVMTKALKGRPSQPTEYLVELVKGKSIKIYREKNGVITEGKTFEIGDQAEWGSFNLSYYGPILSISDSTVTISNGMGAKKHRLDLYRFCWRNHDFDFAKKQAENRETMMYI